MEEKAELRKLAQKACRLARKSNDNPSAQLIAEIYKFSIRNDRLTKIFLAHINDTSSREETFEYYSYCHMARNKYKRQPISDDPQESRLLGLPAELRNTIYRFALVNADATVISQEVINGITPLLHVCQQIRAEAASIFFAENTFLTKVSGYGEATFETTAWLHSLRPSDASAIKHVRVEYLLPLESAHHLADARALWLNGNDFGASELMAFILSQQDENAASFLGSLDGTSLKLEAISVADSVGSADGKTDNLTPAHFHTMLVESWKSAIRKRVDGTSEREVEKGTLEKLDAWMA